MFGTHFYHATMRKSVAVFGTLFNDIHVVRKKSDGSIVNQIRVPLAYGPKQKFLSRLDQETGFDAPMSIKLPRMAFEITSLELDVIQKGQKRNKIFSGANVKIERKISSQRPLKNIGSDSSFDKSIAEITYNVTSNNKTTQWTSIQLSSEAHSWCPPYSQ